ncbi:MAG: UDP-N-acetylmuramate--L-alanine ligase [Anaerolineaceae bacterium]
MTHIHLIGIGGTGISSIARVLVEKGYTVSGSDRLLSPLARDLAPLGVTLYEGHAAANVTGADVVVRSSAIPNDNPEVVAARERGIPVLKRADFLNTFLREFELLAVAGSHGKTTTSTMLAWSLQQIGLEPGFILGGVSRNLGTNASAGGGRYFVIEADEYDYMFLGLDPALILITNVEYDHPDCFPTPGDYHAAFISFVKRLQPGGILVTNLDHPGSAALATVVPPGARVVTYGLTPSAELHAGQVRLNARGGMDFDLSLPGQTISASLRVPGEHNVRNALGVLAVHYALGTSLQQAAVALSEYAGAARRFEVIGEVQGITIISDYAHHPSKIKATLAAARSRYPQQRIVAVWQPHTFSRTQALENDFIASFHDADQVIVTDVYAARETNKDYSVADLVQRIDYVPATHIHDLSDVTQYLAQNLQPEDVVIVMSAGDADQVCIHLLQVLQERKG